MKNQLKALLFFLNTTFGIVVKSVGNKNYRNNTKLNADIHGSLYYNFHLVANTVKSYCFIVSTTLLFLSYNFAEAQNITVASGQTLTISTNTTYSTLTVSNGGTLIVQSPATLTVGTFGNAKTLQVVDFQNGSVVNVNAGAFMVVYGKMNNSNNSNNVTINGDIYVDGNYTGGQKSAILGNGTFNSSGSMITDDAGGGNDGLIFNSPTNCSTGPCSGNNLTCSMANTITTANQSICQGTPAAALVATTITSATYQWQSSANGSAFTDISGATSKDYSPGAIPSTTYYLRKATTTCTNKSSQRVVVVSTGVPTGTATIAGTSPVCQNTSNTYTVTGVSGATGYTWSIPSGATITSGAGTSSVTVTMGTANGTVSVVPFNVCGNATGVTLGSKSIVVQLSNAATISYSSATYCKNITSAQIPTISGTTGGVFSYSGSGNPILNAFSTSTGSFIPNLSTANKTYTITYTMPATACAGAIASTSFDIANTNSFVTGAITGSGTTTTPLCQGSAGLVFTVNSGATIYAWSVPSGTTITSGTNTNSIVVALGSVSGNVTVTPTSTCAGNTATKAITITATPSIVSTAPASRCGTGSVTLGATASAGTINWFTGSTGGSSIAAGISYAPTVSTTTTFYVDATNGGCTTSTRTQIAATVNACTITWTGATSIDWNTAANWSSSSVPTTIDDVIIPSSVTSNRMPTISASSDVKSVTNSGIITVTSVGTLNVYGNISSTGTFTTVAGSTVSFNGNSAQTVSGVPVLHNLVINNTSGGVSLSSALTVKGTLYLKKGVLTTNSNLTINFDNGGNIAYASTDLGSISGTVNGRRDLIMRTHYIAAPFSGATSAQVAATTPLYQNTYWRMYTKDFTAQNWTAVTNATTAMPLGTGFSLTLATAAPLILSGTYNHTFTFTGPGYSNALPGKYLLVGNPYPSTLNWSTAGGWIKTNVGGAIYYWDPANSRVASYVGGFGTNGGTQYVPAMQSFLVTTTGSGGSSSVSINNNARTTQNTPYFRVAQDDIVRITLLRSGATTSDDAVIRFNEAATGDFDSDLDAFKILNTGETPSVFTTSKGNTYSINSYASVDAAPFIPIGTKLATDGSYKLKISGTNPNIDYILVDKLLGTAQSIEEDSAYAFNGLKTDDVNRFELQLRVSAVTTPTGVQSSNKDGGLGIYSSTKGFVIKTDRYAGEKAEIEILDMTGKSIKVLTATNLSMGSTFIPLDITDGAYLINVHVNADTFAGMIALIK